jgi:hypothetical protein
VLQLGMRVPAFSLVIKFASVTAFAPAVLAGMRALAFALSLTIMLITAVAETSIL